MKPVVELKSMNKNKLALKTTTTKKNPLFPFSFHELVQNLLECEDVRQKEGEEKTINKHWVVCVGGGVEKEETWKDGRQE